MAQFIEKPEINVIKTLPTSLGRIDYFMVVCERPLSRQIFLADAYDADGVWCDSLGNQIAERVAEDNFELPLFVLHATASTRAEPATLVSSLSEGDTFFSKNVTQFDSAITLHCLAVKNVSNMLHFRTGFHYFQAGDSPEYEGPTSWDTMPTIYDNIYKSFVVAYGLFENLYARTTKIWQKAISS